jgi:probable rRNA maturation factor
MRGALPGSTYPIAFQIEMEGALIPQGRLAAAIARTLDLHDVDRRSGVTVVITTDEAVRALNASMRGVDAPTDILSFPSDAPPLPPEELGITLDADEMDPYLGDLVIAYPYTSHQAYDAGHNLDDELTLLVIHGTLHLLGYDHDTAEAENEMWDTQAELLKALNVPITVPRFHEADDVEPDGPSTPASENR